MSHFYFQGPAKGRICQTIQQGASDTKVMGSIPRERKSAVQVILDKSICQMHKCN